MGVNSLKALIISPALSHSLKVEKILENCLSEEREIIVLVLSLFFG